MSFCRPLLLSFHAPKFPRKHLATRSLSKSYHAVVRTQTSRHRDKRSLQFLGEPVTQDILDTTSPSNSSRQRHIPERVMSNTNTEAEKTIAKLQMAEYEEERARNPTAMANWQPSTFLDAFYAAIQLNEAEMAESVISDIMERYEGREEKRCEMLARVLVRDLSPLKCETILRVLQELKDLSWPGFDYLITRKDGSIARKMLYSSKIIDTDRPFLRLFYPAILRRLSEMHNPKMWKGHGFRPPHLIHVCFAAVHKLLTMSFQEHALNIFQVLVNTGFIPIEALPPDKGSSDNASLVISLATIRACLHWNYRALAASIITHLITNNPVNKAMIDINIEIIHSLLAAHQTPRAIASAGHLIRQIHPFSPVPDSVIRLFYNSAFDIGARRDAEVLYSFTRQNRVLESHEYPPPENSALPWLMDHLATTSSRTHMSRTLAMEAAENDLWIPATSRAPFIAKVATLGYAIPARALWERYSRGKDGAIVAGNAALMLSMVKLFWKMHKTNLEKVKALEGRKAQPEVQEKIDKYKTVSKDAAVLAEHVRRAFMFHHAPLTKAPHFHLTSLARACFVVGRLSEGYRIFSHLLNRREAPDLYDCNVSLSAIAQINPRLGATMIEKMDAAGLHPDGVSFGTVLHYAVLQGEQQVVDDMIKRIRTLKDRRVSTKTLANLVRVTCALEKTGTREALRQTLANIMHLINSFPELNLKSQPGMGKQLVYISIRAKDGLMAYKFWKLMLQKSAQWDDNEQQNLRHAIAHLIRDPTFPVPEHKNVILAQLAQRKMNWYTSTT
ncbi:hypothetical protein C0992_000333 [Termitomyces sp. T32_za158]|nr:hypothetical protein C0992_000333 [Termitomyces sp. T32_za158]